MRGRSDGPRWLVEVHDNAQGDRELDMSIERGGRSGSNGTCHRHSIPLRLPGARPGPVRTFQFREIDAFPVHCGGDDSINHQDGLKILQAKACPSRVYAATPECTVDELNEAERIHLA